MNIGLRSGNGGRATWWRGLLVALLVYVALDMSLPMMPGAFVFEPKFDVDTVDGFQSHRGRPLVALPSVTRTLPVRPEPPIDVSDKLVPTHEVALGFRATTGLPRATIAPAPSPEDSH